MEPARTQMLSQPAEMSDSHENVVHSWRIAGPTQRQWLDIKPIFTELYIRENRKLKDVRAVLSRRYGFDASEKMFKRRITEWKIHKNYKAKDKELLAKHVKACVDAGQDLQSISFRGRPVLIDRVKRHYKFDKRFTRLWEQLSESPEHVGDASVKEESPSTATVKSKTTVHSSASPQQSDEPHQEDLMTLPRNLLPAAELHDAEIALFQARDVVRWQFASFRPVKGKDLQLRFPNMIPEEVRSGQTDQVSAFWLGLYRGFDLFQTGHAGQAWPVFDKCCNMVQPLLYTAPVQLLSCLLVHFATPWEGMAALEQQLLAFITSMTEQACGEHHPLTKVMQAITSATSRDIAVESMMQMVVEGYTAHRKSSNASLFALRVDQIDLLRKRQKFQHAVYLCQKLVKDSRSMKPKRYRSALAALGRLYVDQKEEFAVEGVAHRILEHETLDSGSKNSGSVAWAYDQLATLCINRQEFGLAEQYLQQAANMSHGNLPHRGPSAEVLAKRWTACRQRAS